MKNTLLAAAVSSALLSFGTAYALPTGENVINGGVTVSRPSAQTMQINQSTQKGIVNWQAFSIGSGEHVNITQPGASSVLLNRVVGNDASQIFGRLTANGQVFLVNTNGVLFAPGASVEVGSLLATTLSITDQDFLNPPNGKYPFANAGGAGSVINQGNIVALSGYAALAGPRVRNEGTIIAHLGTAALAAGDRVTLDLVGDGLINVSVDAATLNASAVNSGTIEANGGRILLTARTANALLDTVVNTGTLRATRLEERNGEIVLDAGSNGIVRSTGILDAPSVVVIAAEANLSDPADSGGPLIPPTPGPLPGPATITGSATIVANPGVLNITATSIPQQIVWSSISMSSSPALTIGSPILLAGGVSSLLAPMPQSGLSVTRGYVSLSSPNGIGLLAPMRHGMVGAGVNLPTDQFLRLQ